MKVAFITASLAAVGSMTWLASAEPENEQIPEQHGRVLELPPVTSAPISGHGVIQQDSEA